jgi:putative isomerase
MHRKNPPFVIKVVYSFLIFILFTAASVCAQDLSNIKFDIARVPFSRFGSYMSLSTLDHDHHDDGKIHLCDLSGSRFSADNTVLTIEPRHEQETLPVKYEGTPLQLQGKTTQGTLTFYFENPERLHVTSDGPGVFLKGNLDGSNTLRVPGYNKTWKLRDERMVLTIKSGSGGFKTEKDNIGFWIEPEQGHLDIVIEQYHSDWLPVEYTVSYAESMEILKKQLLQWEKNTVSVSPAYEQGRQLAAYINWSCIVKPEGNVTRYGMLMSKNWMFNIWSWDNCFNAIALSYHQPKLSWDQLMLVFDKQDSTGALPDYINAHHLVWEFRKPPIHGWTLGQLMEHSQLSQKQLAEIYPKLVKWTNYWFIYRDGNHNGLPEYYHGNDSGWDNGSALDMEFPIEGPDLASFLIKQMEVLAKVATKLGKQKDAVYWNKRADTTLNKMISSLWNGEKFVSKNALSGKVNKDSRSLMAYLPMLIGDRLPKKIRDKMVDDLKKPGSFVTKYGLASESPQSKLYGADSYWRGPVWAPPMLLIIDGLNRSGEKDFARQLAERFCNTCEAGGFAENFDALTGQPLRDPAYTWTSSTFLILAHQYLEK